MSIGATSNYMSNADILVWMQEKTGDLYGNMTAAMSSADTNGDAEAALNKIKADIANTKTDGGDAAAIHDEVNAALAQYGDVPGVKDVLQPIADKLNSEYGTTDPVNGPFTPTTVVGFVDPSGTVKPSNSWNWTSANNANTQVVHQATSVGPKSVKLSSDEVDTWTKNIDGTLSDLGKKDSLALINIQEINSEINQAKQTASALMDSADKSANAIINHIA
jgi:hypothetical protein